MVEQSNLYLTLVRTLSSIEGVADGVFDAWLKVAEFPHQDVTCFAPTKRCSFLLYTSHSGVPKVRW
jgi:hypothetical protein